MQSFDITKYLNVAMRRKWWITIPFLLVVLAGLTYILIVPKIYKAQTLILVQPQRVPEDFVRAIVSTTVEDRLRTITQQVTSRTNLEEVIKEHGLYSHPEKSMLLDDKVALLRKMITIDVTEERRGRGTSAFTIAFRGKDPRKVMEVTNALASNFIAENLKIRESQALGTSSFISDELKNVEYRLKEKEEELKNYKKQYMGGLPEQLETNLTILERLQRQLDQLNSNLRDAENRKIVIQTQISEQERSVAASPIPSASTVGGLEDITTLKNELASLEVRYTRDHPDVIRLRETITKLELEKSESEGGVQAREQAIPRVDQALTRQLQDIALEIKSSKEEIGKLRSQIRWYQGKVEETPKREQELLSLNRDYENLKEVYNSLLNRKLEAEIAVSMERKQKGEQFRVIDPAKIPVRPVDPNLQKIILMVLALGLGLGGGLAYLVEAMDTSYKSPEDIEEELQVPVLVSMPIRYTEREVRAIQVRKIFAFASVTVGFALSAIGIVFAVKGVDTTLNHVNNIIDKLLLKI